MASAGTLPDYSYRRESIVSDLVVLSPEPLQPLQDEGLLPQSNNLVTNNGYQQTEPSSDASLTNTDDEGEVEVATGMDKSNLFLLGRTSRFGRMVNISKKLI